MLPKMMNTYSYPMRSKLSVKDRVDLPYHRGLCKVRILAHIGVHTQRQVLVDCIS
jgi:hypothetical protein